MDLLYDNYLIILNVFLCVKVTKSYSVSLALIHVGHIAVIPMIIMNTFRLFFIHFEMQQCYSPEKTHGIVSSSNGKGKVCDYLVQNCHLHSSKSAIGEATALIRNGPVVGFVFKSVEQLGEGVFIDSMRMNERSSKGSIGQLSH